MSLLSICMDVAGDAPVAVPSTIIGNGDTNAKLLLVCAQRAGEALARFKGGGWTPMIKENLFSTVSIATTGTLSANSAVVTGIPSTAGLSATLFGAAANGVPNNTTVLSVDSGTQVTLNQPASQAVTDTPIVFGQFAYPLPSDFQRIVTDTDWDRLRRWPMAGPQSPQQWQYWKSGIIGTAYFFRRWRLKELTVAGIIADYFCIDPIPTDNASALVWEYVSNAWCQSASGTPQKRWAADTDTGILDEHLLSLGIEWRFLKRLGLAYSAELDEYETETAKAFANDGGMPVLSLEGPSRGGTALSDVAVTGLVTWP